jgi:hypothetical protein
VDDGDGVFGSGDEPVSGVDVVLDGLAADSVTTGTAGDFRLEALAPGEHTVSCASCVDSVTPPRRWSGSSTVFSVSEGELATVAITARRSCPPGAFLEGPRGFHVAGYNGDFTAPEPGIYMYLYPSRPAPGDFHVVVVMSHDGGADLIGDYTVGGAGGRTLTVKYNVGGLNNCCDQTLATSGVGNISEVDSGSVSASFDVGFLRGCFTTPLPVHNEH